MAYTIPRTMEQALEAKIAQHVARYVSLVRDGHSYTHAWACIVANTTFGPAIRKALESRCVEAANRAVREVAL